MNKEKYIARLRKLLRSLPEEEIESAVDYVAEYFEEATKENFEQAYNDLGSPQKFAAQVKADYAIRQNKEEQQGETAVKSRPVSKKKSHGSGWIILLGILSLPLSLPLLACVVVLIFCGILVVCMPVLILGILIACFLAATLFLARVAVSAVTVSLTSAAIALAGVLIMAALFCLMIAGLLALIGKLVPWIIMKLGDLYYRLKGEHGYESVD